MKDNNIIVASGNNVEVSQSEDGLCLYVTANMGFLNNYNLNGVMLTNSEKADESVRTLINRPIKGKLRKDFFGNERFGSHEAYEDEEGRLRFNTETIGTHYNAFIQDVEVQLLHGSREKAILPCMFGQAIIWIDEYPSYAEAIVKLYSEGRLGTSWELFGNDFTDDGGLAESLGIDNPRSYSSWTMTANTIIGVQPAYGENSRIIHTSQDEDANRILSEALEKDFSQTTRKEDYGTGNSIEIDRSVDSASNSSWGDVNKTDLRNKALKAKNYKSLVDFIYLDVEESWEDAPSQKLSYPVGQIIGDRAVYNINGIQSALAFLRNPNTENNPEVNRKLRKLYEKFDLDTKNFNSTHHNDDEDDYKNNSDNQSQNQTSESESNGRSTDMEERLKQLELDLAEANQKLKEYEEAGKDAEIAQLKEEMETLKTEKSDAEEKLVKATESLETLTSQVEELKPYKEKIEVIEAEKAETEKQVKIAELTEMVTKGDYVTKEELETSEELKTMISECNEDALKVFRAERILEKLDAEEKKDVETSQSKEKNTRKDFSEDTRVSKDAMTDFLNL